MAVQQGAEATEIVIAKDLVIQGEKVVEGSVSLSSDDSEIIKAKYEGGEVAAIGGRVKYTLKYQTYGVAEDAVGFKKVDSCMLTTSGSSLVIYDCTQIITVGWNSSVGFVTDITVEGYATES